MSKICRLVLLPVLLLTAGSAFAELKIAVVNVQRAIGESNEAKALIAKLEADTSADQAAIKALGADITKVQEKFNKDGDVMSDAEKRKLQKEIEDKQIDYQFRVNKFQKTVNERQQEILSHEELFIRLYDRLPKELFFIRELILSSLWRSPEHWTWYE